MHDMLNDNTLNGIHTKGMDLIFQMCSANGPPRVGGFEPECWDSAGKYCVDECKKFVPNPKLKCP
jgi:hypothetical protein